MGRGGGVVRLQVSGTFTMGHASRVSSDGVTSTSVSINPRAGGAAGGSVWISAATFAVVIASVGAWAAITQWFNLQFSVPWLSLAIGGAALIVLLFAIAIIYVRLVIGRGIMARVRAMI